MEAMNHRRRLLGGAVALIGGGLVGKAAEAFPPRASGDFRAASAVLGPYGVSVSGYSAGGQDSLDIAVAPLSETRYVETVSLRDAQGFIIPCIRTSYVESKGIPLGTFEHFHETKAVVPCVRTTVNGHTVTTHELFDDGQIVPCVRVTSRREPGGHIGDVVAEHLHANDAGAIIPCVRTSIDEGHTLARHELLDSDQGGVEPCFVVESQMREGGHIGEIVATHLHPAEEGGIIPCVRTSIDAQHAQATYELFDGAAHAPAPIRPALTLTSAMGRGGALGAVEVSLGDPAVRLGINVGARRYVLRDGELVEEKAPA